MKAMEKSVDLRRSLGYGPGLDASVNVRDIMRKVANQSKIVLLDRWKVVVNPQKHFGKQTLLY